MTQSQLHSGKAFIEREVRSLLRRVRVLLAKEVAGLCARSLALMSMCLLLGSALMTQGTSTAFALQAKALTDYSYYMNSTSTSTPYHLGCNQGTADAEFHANGLAILDFGGQLSNGSGTLMINGVSISNGQIEAAAEAFARGYWTCTGSDTTSILDLAIGTNNSYYDVSTSGGQAWAHVVSTAQSYDVSHGYSSQVSMYGADDMEPSFGGAEATANWARGFSSVGPLYFDYGSADGCPQYTTGLGNNAPCNNGWNQGYVWYVSWGVSAALATPEIYNSSQARQWAMISLYGARYQGGHINISGPMDEYDLNTSTYTANGAWDALWTDVNNNSSTRQNFSYSLEIHNE